MNKFSNSTKRMFINGGAISLLLLALLFVITPSNRKVNNLDKASATVKIVRMDERSGGTGVVISSGATSKVLTNSHVCEVVANGGFVISDDDKHHSVLSYQQSKVHDLCLITVAADLGVSTDVSLTAPEVYKDAIVSGHPSLLPTVITTGHYSGKVSGTILIGIKKCTEQDLNSPNAILCIFIGGLPIVRTYEMQVVTATIKPGSSGSAVYNSKGELTNLVFAGSGELGYAMTVPYEYVVNFLNNEVSKVVPSYPDMEKVLSLTDIPQSARNNCKVVRHPLLRNICKLMENSTLYVAE